MDMSTFWSTVTNKLTPAQAAAKHRVALDALAREDMDVSKAEFAEDVVPNISPAGAYHDFDEADLEERDPDQEITDADGPSLGGETAFMAYFPEVDALYMWRDGDTYLHPEWVIWNY